MSNVGDPGWYAVQFGPQMSYREMLFGPFDYADDYENEEL